MSSESSDEDNEKLRDAIDTSLFKDCMFREKPQNGKDDTKPVQKSNRYLSVDEQHRDIRVSADMQNRIGEKISKIIANKIKFVDNKPNELCEKSDISLGGIKLFSDSIDFVSHEPEIEAVIQGPRKKIKRRKVENEPVENICPSIVSVSPEYIISKIETKHWSSRKKPKLFKYKGVKGDRVLQSLDK